MLVASASGMGFNAYAVRHLGCTAVRDRRDVRRPAMPRIRGDQEPLYRPSLRGGGGDGSGTHSIEGNEAMDRGIIR